MDQTYENFELIVINDASSDESEKVISKFKDHRIRYIKNEKNLGLIGTLNKGISMANGKYIARMDQDDIAVSTRFEKQASFMEDHQEVVLCGMQGKILQTGEEYNIPVEDRENKTYLFFGSPFIHPVVMIRKSVLREHGLKYNQKYNHAEDFGLWINLAFAGKFYNLPEVGIFYRLHEMQYTKVFKSANYDSSLLAKIEYLENLGINLSESQKEIYSKINHKKVDFQDLNELRRVGSFYKSFCKLSFPPSIDKKYLTRLIYKKWKIACSNGINEGHNTYMVFLSNPIIYRFFEPRVHFWFLKKMIRL
ncbi:glycosyltransferase [Echinicola sediminis]